MKRQSFASLFLVLFLAATAACSAKPAGGANVSPTVQAPTNTAMPRTQSTAAAAAPTGTPTTAAPMATATTAAPAATATTAAPAATAITAAPSIPFPDPAGLDRLDSYNLTLRITFKGTRNGQAVETSDLYTRAFWREPPAQFTTIETTDEDGTPIKWLFGSVGETQYLRTGPDEPCTVQRGNPSAESKPFNPAIMLRPVWYGKEMGQETVNGVAARHYAIDASSLGQGPSEVSGDVWIADPGAFVVRYELRIKADEAYFGKGTKGEQTTVYELKDIGAKKEMALPAGCPPPVSDLPAMPDAADLVRGPFALTYTTASGMEKTISFYQEKMKALGWILESSADESFKDRWLVFALAKDKEHAFVTLRPEGAQVRVEVQVVQD